MRIFEDSVFQKWNRGQNVCLPFKYWRRERRSSGSNSVGQTTATTTTHKWNTMDELWGELIPGASPEAVTWRPEMQKVLELLVNFKCPQWFRLYEIIKGKLRAYLCSIYSNITCIILYGLPMWLSGKESACKADDSGWIPGSERSPGEGNGNLLQYSSLENPMNRGAWWATVCGVAKSRTWLTNCHFISSIENIWH